MVKRPRATGCRSVQHPSRRPTSGTPVYNPEGKAVYNVVPGLVGVILTMTMMMLTAMAIARESERGTTST